MEVIIHITSTVTLDQQGTNGHRRALQRHCLLQGGFPNFRRRQSQVFSTSAQRCLLTANSLCRIILNNICRSQTNTWPPTESEASCPRWSFKGRILTSCSSSSTLDMAIGFSWLQLACFSREGGGLTFPTRCLNRFHLLCQGCRRFLTISNPRWD